MGSNASYIQQWDYLGVEILYEKVNYQYSLSQMSLIIKIAPR